MSNVSLTNVGLDYVTSANSQGILIAVKYWVPVYDYRIDPDLRNNNRPISAISAVAADTAVNRTTPFGEVMYNFEEGYKLSDETSLSYVLSGVGETRTTGGKVITNSLQNNGPVPVNLSADTDIPLGNYYRGDSVVISATAANAKWTFSPSWSAETVNGVNPSELANKSNLFSVVDYNPVKEDGFDYLKGNFRCRLSEDVGSIKYNKIALYVVQYDAGVETSGTPGFFGEAYLESPIKKSRFGDGYNETTIDVQVLLSATGSGSWDTIFYGSSADYWDKVQKGLHSSEKISIGTFQAANAEPKATVQAGQPFDDDQEYERIPQVRMDYPHATPASRRFVSLEVTSNGDISISGNDQSVTIIPEMSACSLGNLSDPFKQLTLRGGGETIADDVVDTDIIIRTSESIPGYGEYFKQYRHMLQAYDDSENGAQQMSATYANTLYGYDVVRDYNDLLIQTRKKSIYILAGARNLAGPAENQGLRHEYNIDDVLNENLESNGNWLSASTCNIVAKGGNRFYGPVELNYVPHNSTTYTSATNWGFISTKKQWMGVFGGITSGAVANWHDYYDVTTNAYADNTTTWNPIGDYITTDSVLFLAGGTIKTFGDVEPGVDSVYGDVSDRQPGYALGASDKKWTELHTSYINLGTTDQDRKSSGLYGLQLEQKFATSTNPLKNKRQTYVYPSTSLQRGDTEPDTDELYIGWPNGGEITRIDSNIINVPGVFQANIAGVLSDPSVSRVTVDSELYANNLNYFALGLYEYGRTRKLGSWRDVTSELTLYDMTDTALANQSLDSATVTIIGETCILNVVGSISTSLLSTSIKTRFYMNWTASTEFPKPKSGFLERASWMYGNEDRGQMYVESGSNYGLFLFEGTRSFITSTGYGYAFTVVYRI